MIKKLVSHLGEYKRAAILTPILSALEAIMDVLLPTIMAFIIDQGIEKGDMNAVIKYGLLTFLVAAIALLLGVLAGRFAATASTGFAGNLRDAMYENIQHFSFSNIDKYSTAGLVTRMTTDVTNLQNAFQMIERMCVRAPVHLVFALIMASMISRSLTMVFLVAIVFLVAVLAGIMVPTFGIFDKVFKNYDNLNASVQENVSAIRVVKSFVREHFENEKYTKACESLYKQFVHAESRLSFNNPAMLVSVYGCNIALSWFGAHYVLNGAITTGQLNALFGYIMNILMALMMLSMAFVMIAMSAASARRIVEVLDETTDLPAPKAPVQQVRDGGIEFEHVTFKYKHGSGQPVLNDVTFSIRPGETLGIIGGTGSAKSSLVQLIPRLYDAETGSVKVGGVDVKDYSLDVLRREVSMVLQKNVLFSGTILDNLRWGDENASEEECIRVAKLACADEFIERFPDKYNTWIEQGGSNVSGGQKQRLTIARALLRKPKVLILDDSTSAVDTATEDFFTAQPEPTVTPTVTPAAPAEEPEQQPAPEPPLSFGIPLYDLTPTPEPAPQPVSAENAAAFRSEPDEDGWISITSDPVEEKDLNTLVAAAMEKPAVSEEQAANAPAEETETEESFQYQYPSIELFERAPEESDSGAEDELKANAQKLVDTLESFGVRTRVLDISRGPSVTRYEVQPMAGVKISRITSLADDIALNLAVADVRMEAPIPGKPAVGIEVPNHKKTPVYIRSVFESQSFLRMTSPMGIALGKDIAGVAQVADLCKMPHLLIAGSTGSGKSVCVNSIIMSLLFRSSPEDVKLLLIDPKVVELAEYNGIPHLLMPVVTEPRKAAGALGGAVQEMERRYHLFAENNVRDIKSFNKLAATDPNLEKMPYIAIIIDELADLMMVVGKDVEDSICRIAQKARAAGMHLIVATQRPSVDVITGLIKANIPSRIAFAVSSQVDSRTILDGAGAEKLLGMGDMLFMPVGAPKPTRIQGTFVRDEEISRVLDFIKKSATVQYDEAMIEAMEKHAIQDGKKGSSSADSDEEGGSDPMLKQAVEVVIDAGQASTSLLQRRCKLGYARAARIMDEMEEKGIIGPYEGAKPRAVLISRQQWLEMQMNQPDE